MCVDVPITDVDFGTSLWKHTQYGNVYLTLAIRFAMSISAWMLHLSFVTEHNENVAQLGIGNAC